ncbi:EF-hand calcium-binding domain-containing protein 14 [Takifugu rubripes]|uniref:EF-hand calcium binding domain 14 n=1 Tax=Takifugu rubripes TaxID=31033 RepID=A0A3B5KUB6_TAKRU|nr:EF-hand calcium-binding domain-containing protein 14 [Takifugu rubripes]|eukprot:XP_003975334.1 PREDICTED: EF-hand calcium-binding domain-containing protein 14 [Takifugu rubripes]
MKKRKELNALIGLGDSKRKKTKKGSGHRLLRTEPPDSESDSSSDDDEFNNISSGTNFGKRTYAQCCNVCYPLFLFIILAACVMACAGLVWMQIALKEDLDALKEKLQSMESSQKAASIEIPKLSEDLKIKERKLDDFENGDKGFNKLWSNLTEINRKITLLDSAVNHLKANLKSAAELVSLPTTVEELQKSVATIGSSLTSVQHDVRTMQAALENQKKDDDSKKITDITDLRNAVSEANKMEEAYRSQSSEQMHGLLATVAELQQRVLCLEKDKKTVNDTTVKLPATSESGAAEGVDDRTTSKPLPGDAEVAPTAAAEAQTSTFPRLSPQSRSRRSAPRACPEKVFLPGVASLKDLEQLFLQAGIGLNSLGLTHRDLRTVFGTLTPSTEAMACFDTDGDRRFSLMELRAAVGV